MAKRRRSICGCGAIQYRRESMHVARKRQGAQRLSVAQELALEAAFEAAKPSCGKRRVRHIGGQKFAKFGKSFRPCR